MEIDVDNPHWYLTALKYTGMTNEEGNARTRKRLQQIKDLGMEETGNASFGIPDLMSGLYIEMVWSHSDEQWDRYIEWVKDMKANPPSYNTKYKKVLESPMMKHVGKTGTPNRDNE